MRRVVMTIIGNYILPWDIASNEYTKNNIRLYINNITAGARFMNAKIDLYAFLHRGCFVCSPKRDDVKLRDFIRTTFCPFMCG